MDNLILYEKDIIDQETEAHYTFHSSLKDATGPHSHDFYEFFLVTEGKLKHLVNSSQQVLEEGALVFIRPQDCHYYMAIDNLNGSYINLAFPKRVIDSLFIYLGDSFRWEHFLSAPNPPIFLLSKADKEILKKKLESLNLISLSDKASKRSELRTLLAELFTRYMLTRNMKDKENESMPEWLNNLLNEMKKSENFAKGISALEALSGKTHEHICREMKKYLKETPSSYINALRLDYAANLLFNTDMSVISIALEAGFANLSHFNHLFKNKFKISPSSFRKGRLKEMQ